MKKFFSAVLIALVATVFIPAMTCEALDSVPVTDLKYVLGNWYDAKGNLVLTISNDYKINGCTVLSVKAGYDTAALYEIKINEGTGYRDIVLCTDGSVQDVATNPKGNHEWLILNFHENNEITLRKTKEPHYFESVGGIYLGMHKDDVTKLYGQPSSVETDRWSEATWKYRGFDVLIRGEVVHAITIYPYGDRRFDWSGLSARSSVADFEYKYNSKVSSRGNINIGHGELIRLNKIRFGNNGVYLGIFTPGYVF